MAELNQLKTHENYLDTSLVKIPGPDGTTISYQYDEQQRAFYARESSLPFTGRHGGIHISTDPIPGATCTTPGLMSSDDKCRLDALVGTRIGVLGFTGAGFPDDGGYMDGDVILAPGSENISLERVGNVIRFVVDIPAIFNCGNEDCLQIYWIQDETDIAAIRPPVTGGRLLGTNTYGEMKIYLFPDNTVVNPASPATVLNRKGYYPTFIFKRYDDGIGINEGEIDVVLKRNDSGTATVGWAFTPGATGRPEWNVFLGLDDDNNRITFKLDGSVTNGVLGAVLYNGHVITKKSAIISGYDSTVVTSNIYKAKWWDIHSKTEIGTEFSVTNQSQWDLSTDIPVLDSATDSLLSIGQVIDVWSFKVGETNGTPAYVHYCRERPPVNTSNLWVTIGSIQFGDILRDDISAPVDDLHTMESSDWGSTGINDQLNIYIADDDMVIGKNRVATIDQGIPALVVAEDEGNAADAELPVMLWHRTSLRDAYLEFHLACPEPPPGAISYPPIDVLFRAPIDSFGRKYAKVLDIRTLAAPYAGQVGVLIKGPGYNQWPMTGTIRTLYNSGDYAYGQSYRYTSKLLSYSNTDQVLLVMDATSAPAAGEIIELVPQQYLAPAARLQFDFDNGHDILMQPIVGTLNMATPYKASDTPINDLAGDFAAGYAVGNSHWQDGVAANNSSLISASPEGFIVYTGSGSTVEEIFNILRVKVEDNKVWIWWNDLLLSPNQTDSALLPTPVDISTPYFPITDSVQYGKFGIRLWPGAKLRRFIIRSKPVKFSEFTFGQIEVG